MLEKEEKESPFLLEGVAEDGFSFGLLGSVLIFSPALPCPGKEGDAKFCSLWSFFVSSEGTGNNKAPNLRVFDGGRVACCRSHDCLFPYFMAGALDTFFDVVCCVQV